MSVERLSNPTIVLMTKSLPLRGGVERWFEDLVSHLLDRELRCVVGLADGPRFNRAETYLDMYPRLREADVELLDGRTGMAAGRLTACRRLIRESAPCIVVPVMLHEGLVAAVLERTAGTDLRVVYPIHEASHRGLKSVEAYEDVIDLVISPDKLLREAIGRWTAMPPERCASVRCGAAPPTHLPVRDSPRRPLRIGYCSRLENRKKRVLDLPPIIDNLVDLGVDFRLVVAGDGPQRPRLEEYISARAPGRSVFLGGLKHDELLERFFPGIDVLLITSESETGPMVAWEAMLHGVVVVSSRYRGVRLEGVLVHEETALLFDVADANEAAKQIGRLSASPETRRLLGEAARRRAQRSLRIETTIRDWADHILGTWELPAREARATPPGRVGALVDLVEHLTRRALRRPRLPGSPQLEWPMYLPSACVGPSQEAEFQHRFGELEERLLENR